MRTIDNRHLLTFQLHCHRDPDRERDPVVRRRRRRRRVRLRLRPAHLRHDFQGRIWIGHFETTVTFI